MQNIFHKVFDIFSIVICNIVKQKMHNKTIFGKSMFMVVLTLLLCMHHYFITSPISAEDTIGPSVHRLLFTPGWHYCDILVMMVTRHLWPSARSPHNTQTRDKTTVTQLLFIFASFDEWSLLTLAWLVQNLDSVGLHFFIKLQSGG